MKQNPINIDFRIPIIERTAHASPRQTNKMQQLN